MFFCYTYGCTTGTKQTEGQHFMEGNKLQANIDALRALVNERGWRIIDEKAIQFGSQLTVSDGQNKIPVAFYTSGKALIQGKDSPLRSELQTWWYGKQPASSQPATPATKQSTLIETPAASPVASLAGTARMRFHVSGAVDYFGPLGIAAVFVV